jgi:DNA-binding CsgD family transcriptional regulator
MLGTIREFGAEQLAGTTAETRARQRLIRRSLSLADGFRSHLAADDQLSRLTELHREHASVGAALGYALGGQVPARPPATAALDEAALAYEAAEAAVAAGAALAYESTMTAESALASGAAVTHGAIGAESASTVAGAIEAAEAGVVAMAAAHAGGATSLSSVSTVVGASVEGAGSSAGAMTFGASRADVIDEAAWTAVADEVATPSRSATAEPARGAETPGDVTASRSAGIDPGADWADDGIELAVALTSYWRIRCPAEGCYWLGRAAALAPAGSPALARTLLARAHLLTAACRPAEALSAAAAAADLAAALGDRALIARAELVRNGALICAGDLAAAAESGQVAQRLLTAAGDRPGLITLHIQLAYLNLLGQDSWAALGHVDHGLQLLDGSRERWLHAVFYLLAALTLYQADRDIEATWTATRALQVTQETGDTLGTAFAVELLGWIAARAGAPQRATWLLGGADPLWERAGGRLASAAAFGRLHDDAVAGCEAVLGDRRFAELYARAAVQPTDAIVTYALHDEGDQVADTGVKIRLPAQLTAREQEIAGLVVAGLSNRQIAERLVISRRTVDAHLEHIFGKLGITSRVMLTIQLREYPAEPGSGAQA